MTNDELFKYYEFRERFHSYLKVDKKHLNIVISVKNDNLIHINTYNLCLVREVPYNNYKKKQLNLWIFQHVRPIAINLKINQIQIGSTKYKIR